MEISAMEMADSYKSGGNEFPEFHSLNDKQSEAVRAVDGPVLILAGAGTGKTRVLTTRISHIINQGLAYPSEILAVTFTNKAAREMSERVEALVNSGSAADSEDPSAGMDMTRGMWLGTFHSIAAKILRRHAEVVGLSSNFVILDSDDQLRLIKAIMQENGIDEKMYPPKIIHSLIQGWKDIGLVPEKVGGQSDNNPSNAAAVKIYKYYQARLLNVNACDFGDLLLHNLALFRKIDDEGRPYILEQYQNRFRYIMVDEYQDTNISQYIWLKLLAMGHKNICCVGDDDQSIYGWRGAEVGNILKFEKDYANATIVRLEQNYRSTPHILSAASSLISNNKGRLGKTLWTEAKDGEKIKVKSVWDDSEESRYIGETIEDLQRKGFKLSDMGILVRAGFQTRAFEERLLTIGVPYIVIGGLRFYERLEIRDAIAYLRIIQQPRDDLAFERIVNKPKRGVGKATLENIHVAAREQGISLSEAAGSLIAAGAIKGKAKSTLSLLLNQIQQWQEKSKDIPLADLVKQVLDESGYINMWREDKNPESAGRIENLQELIRALAEFEDAESFLEHISLVMDNDKTSSEDMLSIMTLHASKGLEFDVVFLAGWEEGLFPHQRSIDESGAKGVEEERRLAYVGITRARKLLHISHAANRRIYNQWQSSIPSRFLEELPLENIECLEGGPQRRVSGPKMMNHEVEKIFAESEKKERIFSGSRLGNMLNAEQRQNKPSMSSSKSYVSNPKSPHVGKKVTHVKFGEGRVVASDGKTLDIEFKKAGRKKIMKDFVKI